MLELIKRLPAQWERQRLVLLSFPHPKTDWKDALPNAFTPFIRIAQAISYKEPVYIICHNKEEIASLFCNHFNMTFIEIDTNDTWIRDYGYISIYENDKLKLLDFNFNAWGNKFEYSLDNSVNYLLHKKGYMGTIPLQKIDFILEGGSIDSDGNGTILTTTSCLLSRNSGKNREEIEKKFQEWFGVTKVLWLENGALEGDDTDGHIDTLARFINKETIVYLKSEDKEDIHYKPLEKMEKELKEFKTKENKPYNLIPLPMTKPIYKDKKRLPSTYANFLITNYALIYPKYNDINDIKVEKIFKSIFPNKEVIGVDCRILIEQGGSLHCSTMQIAY